jgi:hypothetical protein
MESLYKVPGTNFNVHSGIKHLISVWNGQVMSFRPIFGHAGLYLHQTDFARTAFGVGVKIAFLPY